MSSIVFTRQARAFYHASDIPDEVWRALSENEAAANVILPFAKKAKKLPRGHDGQFWIALYNGTNNVEFVLSCTRGPLGNYPIFIVPSKASARHAQEGQRDKDLADSLLPLVRCLLDKVDHPDRIFSVFSIARVTEKFAEIFQAEVHARQHHDIQAHKDPYYDATFTFCTSETFNESLRLEFPLRGTEDITISLRRADKTHLEGIKALCKAFSETSPPYILDDERAELEAKTMIANEQVWVHTVQKDDQEPEIACLIATTRESENVTAVTKVFTAERWRGRGCAARLLQRICQVILKKKERVVLYVGNSEEMQAAHKVYRKVGFQGLSQGQQVEGVERWLEIGFKGTTLGYW